MGTQLPPTQKGAEPPNLPPMSIVAGWITIALGMEVGLGPGDIVLDGTQLPSPKKGAELQIFGPFLLWPNGWLHQDATWYGGRIQPRRLCVRWGPSSPSIKRGQSPQFLTHVYCGDTAGILLDGSRCH